MRPTKDEDGLVDLLDVVLRNGAVLRADVVISVAEIPLVGVKFTAAIAGMETMTDYGLFEEWDTSRRNAAVARRQYGYRDHVTSGVEHGDGDRVGVGSTPNSSSPSVRRLESEERAGRGIGGRGGDGATASGRNGRGGEDGEDADGTISVAPPTDGERSSRGRVRRVEGEGEDEEEEDKDE